MGSQRQPGYKLVLLGDASVGKTSLVGRFVTNQFNEAVETTVGAAFSTQSIQADDGRTVKFEIWDTAGQERFKSLAPMYYRNASCAIVVFDLTSEPSLTRAKDWVNQLALSNNPNIIIALAGNKADVSSAVCEEAKKFAAEEHLIYIQTSAKTGLNVQQLFELIANKLPPVPFAPASMGGTTAVRTTNITTLEQANSSNKCCS